MPAPTYTITQQVPDCVWNFGTAIPSPTSPAPPQPLEIHSSCCQVEYGWRVQIGTSLSNSQGLLKVLEYRGALPAGSGPKLFETDAFKICGHNGEAFTGNHSGSGTISGATFGGTGTGTLSGGRSGNYVVTVSGSFTSPGNGSYSGTIGGGLVGTFTGTITAGIASTTYTITNPMGATATDTATYTIDEINNTFTFTATISGNNPPPVNAYYELTWTHCNAGGIVLQLLDADDDSLICEHSNAHYSLRCGWKTILTRTSLTCEHPCIEQGVSSQGQAFNNTFNSPFLCFSPSLRQIARP